MTTLLQRIWQFQASDDSPRSASRIVFFTPGAFLLAGIAVALYLAFYLTDPSTPPLNAAHGGGWKGWYDQGEYYKTAADLAQFRLTPSVYWYGYPLLGALSYRWLPQHPFLLPNLFCVIGMMLCFYAICRRFLTAPESWLITLVPFCCDRNLWVVSLVWPWNSTPVYFAVFATAWLVIFGPATRRRFILAAAIIGLATFCRPPDTPALLALYGAGLLFHPGLRRNYWLWAAPLITIFMAVGLQLSAHLVLYHSLSSPYLKITNEIGLSFSHPFVKLYQWFVDPTMLNGETMLPPGTPAHGAIRRLPHLLILLPGVILILKTVGPKALGLLGAAAAAGMLYLSFNPTSYPSHSWTYHGFHYFWWLAPWVALGAWLTLSRAWRQLRLGIFAGALVLPLAFLSLISFQPQVLGVYPVAFTERNVDSTPLVSNQAKETVVASLQQDNLQLTIPLPPDSEVFAVRVAGQPALPFDASVAGSSLKFTVTRDQQIFRGFIDYYPLGYTDAFYLSFINAPLRGNNSLPLSVRVTNAAAARPELVELIGLEFKPGAAFAALFRRPDFQAPFGAPSLRKARLRSGWSQGGPDYVWTMGPRAVLELATPQEFQSVTGLEIEATALLPLTQKVTVLIDGRKVGETSVSERGTYRIIFPVPQPSGTLSLALLVSDPTKPADLGMNSDDRPLGIAIWSLRYLTSPETAPLAR